MTDPTMIFDSMNVQNTERVDQNDPRYNIIHLKYLIPFLPLQNNKDEFLLVDKDYDAVCNDILRIVEASEYDPIIKRFFKNQSIFMEPDKLNKLRQCTAEDFILSCIQLKLYNIINLGRRYFEQLYYVYTINNISHPINLNNAVRHLDSYFECMKAYQDELSSIKNFDDLDKLMKNIKLSVFNNAETGLSMFNTYGPDGIINALAQRYGLLVYDLAVKLASRCKYTEYKIAPYLYNYPKDILSKLSQLYDDNGTEYIFVCDKYMWPACGSNPFNQQPMLPWGKFRP